MIKGKANNGSLFIEAQATYYPTFVRVYIPKFAIKRDEPRVIGHKPKDLLEEPFETDKETALERSLRRSRKRVKDLVFCNTFDHFVTLTIKTDRSNVVHSKAKVANWINNEKKRKGKFQYVLVPEYHQDKQSLHFHALFQGYRGKLLRSIKANGKPVKEKGRDVYNYPSYTSGYNYIELIDNSVGSLVKVGFYLQKYITKDMPMPFGKKRYWSSRGLKRPIIQDNPEYWYKYAPADREYENEFGKIIEFEYGKNALVDMFIEANKP
jgi:hypothetical protein